MFNLAAIGNLTRDAEFKQFENGAVINFSLAINQRRKDKDDLVTFINCAYNVKGNGLVPYLKKGTKVAIRSGWYQNREYNGNYYQTFYVNELELLGSNQQASQQTTKQAKIQATNEVYQQANESDDGLPF